MSLAISDDVLNEGYRHSDQDIWGKLIDKEFASEWWNNTAYNYVEYKLADCIDLEGIIVNKIAYNFTAVKEKHYVDIKDIKHFVEESLRIEENNGLNIKIKQSYLKPILEKLGYKSVIQGKMWLCVRGNHQGWDLIG